MSPANDPAPPDAHPFALDRFQVEALEALDAGRSVLVAAPTGSGKTVVAEHAVARALASGGKAFYTTPIKALSNQKHLDLRRRHGAASVGLLTGDTAVNGEAPAVVMTTEVLRNMLYERSSTLRGLSVVVLDEVHYLQDPFRGPVWEEVVLHLDPGVQLVSLSATVSNAEELAAWLSSVRGPTEVVVEHHRPVSLTQHLAVADRHAGQVRLLPLLRDGRPDPSGDRTDAPPGPRRGRQRWGRPRRGDVIDELRARELLPALWFIFSRNGCDEAFVQARRDGIRLSDPEDRPRIRAIAERHVRDLSDDDLDVLGYDEWLDGVEQGLAAHHAGMVPALREAVEELFAAGLVRLVFATETLALGVNLPARAVVVDQLSKYRGDGHGILTPAEFTQLTGRAGRRGIDPEGHALVVWSPYVRFREAAELAASREYELRSAFKPTYNMAANLVRRHDPEEAHDLLGRSFAQFQTDRELVGLHRRLADRQARRDELADRATCELGDVAEYAALVAEAKRSRRRTPRPSGPRVRPGDVVAAPGTGTALAVLAVGERKGGRRLRTVDEGGRPRTIDEASLDEPLAVVGRVELPEPYEPRTTTFRRAVARSLAEHAPSRRAARQASSGSPAGPTTDPVPDSVRSHPVHACPDADDHLRAHRRLVRAEREVARLEDAIARRGDSLARRLDRVLGVLATWGYVEGWALTERGAVLARTYHERDLLVAEAIGTGLLDDLVPADLAAVASALTYEHRRREPAEPWPASTGPVRARIDALAEVASALAADERAAKLDPSRPVDEGFATRAHAWASGAGLDEVLDESVPAGDFVRSTRLLVDLLGQVAELTDVPATAEAARAAADALRRGVVAAAATPPNLDDDGDDGA